MRHIIPMLVLIDNYDSFTWNLVQYVEELGARTHVIRNDTASVSEILDLKPNGVLISPGPSDPDHAGICLDLIKAVAKTNIPLLGVCLGHQAIGQAFGGRVVRADQPMHGKISPVLHEQDSVFYGLPSPCHVTRYHSLVVDRDSLPDCLQVTARTADGTIMGLAHKTRPIHGVQFHPESIETEEGHALLANFISMMKEAA